MADYYTTGQITLTNGSASIVGVGTAWQIANVAGGTIFVEGTGNALPLDVIADDTHATASIDWTGASGTYNYALLRATAFSDQLEANSNIMSRLLIGMEAGTIYRYDVSGDLADKANYDDRPKDFGFLAIDVNPAQLFIKASGASGDWAGPFSYGTGPQGIPGQTGPKGNVGVAWRGAWDPELAYSESDIVSDNDGAGDPAVWIAIDNSTNKRPKDNPMDWAFFPGSFPQNLDYGLWSDPVTGTVDYGTWA